MTAAPPPRSPPLPDGGDVDDCDCVAGNQLGDELGNDGGASAATAAARHPGTGDVIVGCGLEAEPAVSLDEDGDNASSWARSQASLYYDASTMASLNPTSAEAISRLRAYAAPAFPLWEQLPVRRRAAVLVLLYADAGGHLRVVVTMRAASLRNFSGHAALPGGKADDARKSPYQIARREAFEEIGLPYDAALPRPFRIEPLCVLPPSLARTQLVVVPCVAFLHTDRDLAREDDDHGDPGAVPLVESLIPSLDAREVAALFSAPLYNFLKRSDLPPRPGQVLPPGHWYDGQWVQWKDVAWRSHSFYVPVNNQTISRPRRRSSSGAGSQAHEADALEEQQEFSGRFKVWGMTGRILVDTARIAYSEEPEMEYNESYGDHDIIMRAVEEGALSDEPAFADGHKGPAKM